MRNVIRPSVAVVVSILGALVLSVAVPFAQWPPNRSGPCPTCYFQFVVPPGHGPVSPTDNRRVLYVLVEPSASTAMSAVRCAADRWNIARDAYGNYTGYYFKVLDPSTNPDEYAWVVNNGMADLTVKN